MVFLQKQTASGPQWETTFEHNGKSYIADVCCPSDRFGRPEGFIGEIGEDGYLILGSTFCPEVEEVSKAALQKMVNDFISGKIKKSDYEY